MAWRFGQVTRLRVKGEVYRLIRSFPTTYIHVKRVTGKENAHGETEEEYDFVFSGKALVRPNSGVADTYGLGTVENLDLVVLVNGRQDIRQSDIVTINDGRDYEVRYPPVMFDAFMSIGLKQRSQISQPTQ